MEEKHEEQLFKVKEQFQVQLQQNKTQFDTFAKDIKYDIYKMKSQAVTNLQLQEMQRKINEFTDFDHVNQLKNVFLPKFK